MSDPSVVAGFGAAMHDFIALLGQDIMDDTYHSMTCGEVDAIAEVMRLGGDLIGERIEGERAARLVLAQHYDMDEPGDTHYMAVGQRVSYQSTPVEGWPSVARLGVVEDDDRTGIIAVRWSDTGGVDNVHVADLTSVYEDGEL